MNITQMLARFVAESRPEAIAEPVQDESVRALVDWLGCSLGGCLEPALDSVFDALGFSFGPAQATLLGRGQRTDLLSASLLQAIAADGLDFSDSHAPTRVPVSVPVASALLPLAESRAACGADVVHAYALGAEVTCRLAQALAGPDSARASRANDACGTIGAAVACSKLLGLDATQVVHAIGIAATQVNPIDTIESSTRAVSIGLAARNGLTAALLAQEGFTSAPQALEGARGLYSVIGAGVEAAALLEGLGGQWQLRQIAYKPYPCDSALHAAIEVGLGVRARHRPLARRVAGVELRVHPSVLARAGARAPQDPAQARRSLYHAVAVALVDGAAGLEQFEQRRLGSVRIVDMRSRIDVLGDDALGFDAARLTLRMQDGSELDGHVRSAHGSPARPLTDAELSAKFRGLASSLLATDQTERILALAWNIRALADIGALIRASVPEDEFEPAELPGSPLIPR